VNATLEELIGSSLDRLGLELVELRLGGSRSRPTLQVRIDHRDGATVTVDDCALASRAIEQELDASGVAGERYVLEVSSPGIDRPLRSVADWRRFVGRRASVVSLALHGRAEVEILAVDGDAGAEVVRLRTERGEERRIALAEITEARLAFTW
jgi:ribosome maturation factor RimP